MIPVHDCPYIACLFCARTDIATTTLGELSMDSQWENSPKEGMACHIYNSMSLRVVHVGISNWCWLIVKQESMFTDFQLLSTISVKETRLKNGNEVCSRHRSDIQTTAQFDMSIAWHVDQYKSNRFWSSVNIYACLVCWWYYDNVNLHRFTSWK